MEELKTFKINPFIDGSEHEMSLMEISSASLALEEAFFNASCKSPDWISLKLKNREPLRKGVDNARANSAAEALGCAQETEGKCLWNGQ